MGDKSPKSKQRTKNQKSADKQDKAQEAKVKQERQPAALAKGSKK